MTIIKMNSSTHVALPYRHESFDKLKYNLSKFNIKVCYKAQNVNNIVIKCKLKNVIEKPQK